MNLMCIFGKHKWKAAQCTICHKTRSSKKIECEAEKIISAAENGKIAMVAAMIKNGADVNAEAHYNFDTALMRATRKGHCEVVKLLLNSGADVNAENLYHDTALMCVPKDNAIMDSLFVEAFRNEFGLRAAIVKNDVKTAAELCAKHLNVNMLFKDGDTLLITASRNRNAEIVKLLLKNGADVNKKGHTGQTALIKASETGCVDIVKLLIGNGADVNAKDIAGETALMAAASRNFIEIAKLLLDKGVDVYAEDNHGKTAVMMASQANCTTITEMLKNSGAIDPLAHAAEQLNGNDLKVRRAAVEALGKLKSRRAVNMLIDALKKENIWSNNNIAIPIKHALITAGYLASVDPLTATVEDKQVHPDIKIVMIGALLKLMGRIGLESKFKYSYDEDLIVLIRMTIASESSIF